MQGSRAKESGGGTQASGGQGELEEGGGRTLYSGNYSGQQPAGLASGQCVYCVLQYFIKMRALLHY